MLAKLYIDLMRESLIGFKSELMLFNGFFKMALTNIIFKNSAAIILNDKEYKKLVPALKDWLKDLQNVIPNIKNEKWGWWRKPKRQYVGLNSQDVIN